MKAIYYIKASLMALATMVACTEMEISNKSQDSTNNGLLQELSITGKDFQFEHATRSSVAIEESGASFAWDEDDVIGIFPDKGDQVSFAMDEGAGTQTATFSGGGWALKSSAKYAAYYPHVYENRDMTAIPVSYLGQTQNGNANTDHIGAYDFMAAGVSTPENGAVAFDMQHLGALVQLTITIPEPSALSKVVLTSPTEFTETGTIDLTADTPAITADTQSSIFEITLCNVTTTEANENVIVYFMVAPINLTDSKLTSTVHFADATTCEMVINGKNFLAGKAYRLSAEAKMLNDYIDEYGVNHGKGTEIDGVVWAPINCGYHATDYPWGKLYQWGRKYGQGYVGNLYDDDWDVIGVHEDASSPQIQMGGVSLNEGNSPDNANIFYTASADFMYNWSSENKSNLWNSGTVDNPIKSYYDPCPAGWRVPTLTEFNKLKSNHSGWISSLSMLGYCGYYFSGSKPYTSEVPRIFLPAAGSLNYNKGVASGRGDGGNYWCSNTDGNYSRHLEFDSTYTIKTNASVGRAQGYSIRCVQE